MFVYLFRTKTNGLTSSIYFTKHDNNNLILDYA